jgi:hypothetical protein
MEQNQALTKSVLKGDGQEVERKVARRERGEKDVEPHPGWAECGGSSPEAGIYWDIDRLKARQRAFASAALAEGEELDSNVLLFSVMTAGCCAAIFGGDFDDYGHDRRGELLQLAGLLAGLCLSRNVQACCSCRRTLARQFGTLFQWARRMA